MENEKKYNVLNETDRQKVLVLDEYLKPYEDTRNTDFISDVICEVKSTPSFLPQGVALNIEPWYDGEIVDYKVRKMETQNNQGVVYITFICEIYNPATGPFLASFKTSANITSNSRFTNLLASLDIFITNRKSIKLDDLIGKKVACKLNYENNFVVIEWMCKR